MKVQKPLVCLIASGMTTANFPLQPWRFLFESARQLRKLDYDVRIISDGAEPDTLEKVHGVPLHRIRSVSNPKWQPNTALHNLVAKLQPEVILWHMGLISILHQHYTLPGDASIVGIFTSPIYQLRNLLQLGLPKLITGYELSLTHLIGAIVPKRIYRHALDKNNKVDHLVVQTHTLGQQIRELRAWSGPLSVILPGVDDAWHPVEPEIASSTRQELGYRTSDKVVAYFGSPAPLRGLRTLVQAFERAQREEPVLKLLILSRRREDELAAADAKLRRFLQERRLREHVQIISGFLPQTELVRYIAAADLVALPFEIVPSDAPLSVLESGALGKILISTTVGCLPELTSQFQHSIVSPSNSEALAATLRRTIHAENNLSSIRPTSDYTDGSLRVWRDVGIEWSSLLNSL